VWAATTIRDRNRLRRSLRARLGDDWVGVVAEQDRRRQAKQRAARHTPLTVSQARIVRLDREINGPLRLRQPLTPAQQQRNMARLIAGLKAA
jgi:WhiB family redox-sensing transcriptional regulator